jgi:hypothetical protein
MNAFLDAGWIARSPIVMDAASVPSTAAIFWSMAATSGLPSFAPATALPGSNA